MGSLPLNVCALVSQPPALRPSLSAAFLFPPDLLLIAAIIFLPPLFAPSLTPPPPLSSLHHPPSPPVPAARTISAVPPGRFRFCSSETFLSGRNWSEEAREGTAHRDGGERP